MDHGSRKHFRSNQNIRAQMVRLLDEHGEMVGIVSLKDALQKANEKNLDLIEVSPNAEPPVCRLCDYSRLRYQEQKKRAEMQKKQKKIVVKEIQLRPSIQENDYKVKLSRSVKFLEDGDRVRVILQFRGREIAFADTGKKVVERFIRDLAKVGKVESTPRLEGKRLLAILLPLRPEEKEKIALAEREEAEAALGKGPAPLVSEGTSEVKVQEKQEETVS